MISGIGEIFCIPRSAQGVHRVHIEGAQREQITALNLVSFWYPYFKSRKGIAMQPHFWANFITNCPLMPFSTIFDTPGCY